MGRIKDNWVYILEYREKFGMPKDADELDAFVVWIEKQKLKDIKRFPTTDEDVDTVLADAPKTELPDKYKNCDWLWVYGKVGLTAEHIKRINNAINLLESLNEHTDIKYLKEIKEKLMAVAN